MAADMKARQDKHSTIAFTLPISCQVCLGKVKQPVLCPNNHVFCSQCLDVWLQRNQQCPACRVTIDPANPVKKILGGLNEATDDRDKMSNPELRKARFDLLYKEYEEEFERLDNQVKLLRTENEVLKQQLRSKGSDGKTRKEFGPQTADNSGVLLLTKKLQDAQRLYEKVKTELSKTKEENSNLKDENINLNRENQRLRMELSSRSPHRYGRITVSTLESKLSNYEKEVGQLNKALEKSDKYIEDLQSEVNELRSKDRALSSTARSETATTKKASESYSSRLLPTEPITSGSTSSYGIDSENPSRRQLFQSEDKVNGESSHKYMGNGDVHEQYWPYHNTQHASKPSAKSTAKNGAGKVKRVTFDLPKDRNETMSFDLEMPSPLTSASKLSLTNGSSESPVKSVLKNGKKTEDLSESFNLAKPSLLDESIDNVRPAKNYTKHNLYGGPSSRSSQYLEEQDDLFKARSDRDLYNESFNLERPEDKVWTEHGKSERLNQDFDDTQVIQNELDDLDISVTPDFTDCLKLLNRAEKKVHNRTDGSERDDAVFDKYQPSQDYLTDYKPDSIPHEVKSYNSGIDNYSSRPESTFTSRYYSGTDEYKPSVTAGRTDYNERTDTALSEKYPSVSSIGTYKSSVGDIGSYKSSGTTDYTRSSRYSVPSSGTSDRFSVPVEDYLKTGDSGTETYRPRDSLYSTKSSEGTSTTSSSVYSSLPPSSSQSRYSLSSKPLGKSVFGKSPSLDNLFMSSRNTSNTGSRYATAEDVHSTGYKSRYSFPTYSSSVTSKNSVGSYSSESAHTGRMSDIGSREYSSSALPPKPVRTRSTSDTGASVSSLSSGVSGAGFLGSTSATGGYNKRFGPTTASSSSYLPNSLTSVTTSSTYSSSQPPSNSYASSSVPAPLISTYPGTSSSSQASKSTDILQGDGGRGAYAGYLSNNSTYDFSKSDSFLPEPKKRLFDSTDDMDLSLSPIKATRIT